MNLHRANAPGFREAEMPPMITGKMMYHFSANQSEIAITMSVGAGQVGAKLLNTSLKAGSRNHDHRVMMNALR